MRENKKGMTNRERVEALLRHEKPDRVPNWPVTPVGFSMISSGHPIVDGYNNPEISLAAQRRTCEDFDWVFYPVFINGCALAKEFGGEIKLPTSEFAQASMITRFPVEAEEDVWNLKMPDAKTAGNTPIAMELFNLSSQERLDNEPFNVMIWQVVFTAAANICGIEKMARWLIKKPEVAHRLLRMTVDYDIELARYYKDTFGTETVLPFIGEPSVSNQIISPRQFEKFALPYIKELCEALLDMGYKHLFVHICGEQNLNLPYWAQIPFGDPGIVSVGHEVDIKKAAEYFPNDIIMGNLEPAIIQMNTAEEVYEATKQLVEEGKKISGGYLFSPGCELPPMAPIENVRAITKAIDDFGWYE